MNPDDISKLAFLLYPHIVRAQPDELSAESLAARIKELQKGLLPEDEFAATVSWLGNCSNIHRIDQAPMPVPKLTDKMRAPDFIAFPMVGDRPVPVLIEVKAHRGKHLDWSESYRRSLTRFAECLNLPLLVAWKCGDLWTLVDNQHFEKNVEAYRLTIEKALTEDLLCVLFRNLRIQMNPELELILDMKILDEVIGGTDALLPAGSFRMQVVRAGLYSKGIEKKDSKNGRFALFLAAPEDDVEIRRTGRQECRHIFRPLPDHGFTLSNVLVTQLSLGAGDDIDWHQILTKGEFPSSGQEFRESLSSAIDEGFVRYVLDVIPNTWPSFIPR
jgi:hypothetical protein